MEKDPAGVSHQRVLALQRPQQIFFNFVFKCETVTGEFHRMAFYAPGQGSEHNVDVMGPLRSKMNESCTHNLSVLSGDQGRKVVFEQASM
eukprot:7075559-Pyramimonas_sp.AAC.1